MLSGDKSKALEFDGNAHQDFERRNIEKKSKASTDPANASKRSGELDKGTEQEKNPVDDWLENLKSPSGGSSGNNTKGSAKSGTKKNKKKKKKKKKNRDKSTVPVVEEEQGDHLVQSVDDISEQCSSNSAFNPDTVD